MTKDREFHRVFALGFASLAAGLVGADRALADGPSRPLSRPPVQVALRVYDQRQDVVFGDSDGLGLVMDIFTPLGAKNGLGLIDVVSGAWYSDRGKIREHRDAQFFDTFCARGYTVFAIRPGSRPKFSAPEMVQHVRMGIRWVRARAGEFHIDPKSMAICGASAGAHLACLTVVSAPPGKSARIDPPFKAVALFFPPTDFLEWGGYPLNFSKDDDWGRMIRTLAVPRGNERINEHIDKKELAERIRLISPARLVKKKQPPFLIIHGDADVLVPLQQSQVFVDALKKAGGEAELIIKHGGGHPWRTINEEVKVMADWLDKELKKPAG